MRLKYTFYCFLLLSLIACQTKNLPIIETIRLNQVGYFPEEEKIGAIIGEKYAGKRFHIKEETSGKNIYSGIISVSRQQEFSDKKVSLLDFSSLTDPGMYRIEIPSEGISHPFLIKEKAWENVSKAALKAFYYQRTAIPIEQPYAGKWSRPAGHPDDKVLIHPSAVSPGRPAGSVISSSKGWYDAGDYNKYIVNSGFTVAILMNLYEDYPEYVKELQVNIPESSSPVPDLLAEVMWNLEWMLTMQDPGDGGVYHKLTTPSFEGFIKPEDCKQPRYVVAKSVTATLDFAASMAQAARIYREYEKEYPGIPDQMLLGAKQAFEWALKNPDVLYDQNKMNETWEPAVVTGGYGDKKVEDEFFWAAVELYITTGEEKYRTYIHQYRPEKFALPTWGNVNGLAYFSVIRHRNVFEKSAPDLWAECSSQLLAYSEETIQETSQSPYNSPYGNKAKDFFWGCNSDAASNLGITLLYAYRLSDNEAYRKSALHIMDYLLGRNATGYCYVTGYGFKSPQYPHHRLSASDGIEEPLPGFLVGGPNPGQQDKCDYPSDIPDESYVDDEASYAANEIAINWQATFTYFSLAMDATL